MNPIPTTADLGPINPADHADVPFFPPLLPLGGLVLGLSLEWIHSSAAWMARLPLAATIVLAVFLIVPGALIMSGSGRALRQAKTNVNPRQPTLSLVRSWPFSFSRNPMYLGGNLLYLGIAVAFHLGWMLLLFPAIAVLCHFLVVRREEEYLERKFGADYAAYKQRVRRWL